MDEGKIILSPTALHSEFILLIPTYLKMSARRLHNQVKFLNRKGIFNLEAG